MYNRDIRDISMNKCLWVFTLVFLINSHALAWRLVIIQSVTNSGRNFTTRTEANSDRMPGREGVFVTDNSSIVARTTKVGTRYTKWEVKDPAVSVPFRQDQLVTFSPSLQARWPSSTQGPSLSTQAQQQSTPTDATLEALFQSKELQRPFDPTRPLNQGMRFRLYQGLGLTESVSGVPGATGSRRAQLQGEISYFWEIKSRLHLDLGIRVDREVNQLDALTITSNRQYITGGVNFYLDGIFSPKWFSIYMGTALSIGLSTTQINHEVQNGVSFILPYVRGGLDIKLSHRWSMELEGGLEAIFLRERIEQALRQEATQINGKTGVGLRYTF